MENEITDANKAVLIVTLLEIKEFATEAIKILTTDENKNIDELENELSNIGTALDRISKEIKTIRK
jgi:hypothetical protein